MNDNFRPWRFDAKNPADRALTPPRVAPDGRPAGQPVVVSALAGVVALGLLGWVEGALVWIALRWAADLGWLPQSPGFLQVVGLTLAVTYLRGIDRAVFRK